MTDGEGSATVLFDHFWTPDLRFLGNRLETSTLSATGTRLARPTVVRGLEAPEPSTLAASPSGDYLIVGTRRESESTDQPSILAVTGSPGGLGSAQLVFSGEVTGETPSAGIDRAGDAVVLWMKTASSAHTVFSPQRITPNHEQERGDRTGTRSDLVVGVAQSRRRRWLSATAVRMMLLGVGHACLVEPSWGARPVSGRLEGQVLLVELHQVVSRSDKPPLRACRRSTSPLELADAPVVLGLGEHGLDHRLAFSVKPASEVTGENGAHERVAPASPTPARFFMLAGIGRDQDLGTHVHDLIDLLLMPVAAVGERDPGRVAHADLLYSRRVALSIGSR